MMKPNYTPSLGSKGEFLRRTSKFRNWIEAWSQNSNIPPPKFPAQPNRYHLIISYACPWACRCLAVLNMKKLRNVISLSVVHPTFVSTRNPAIDPHIGWHFKSPNDPPVLSVGGVEHVPCDEALTGGPDPTTGAVFVRDIYEWEMDRLNFSPEDRKGVAFSVPILWCKETRQIVNNESEEIVRILNSEFNEFCEEDYSNSDSLGRYLDLFPHSLRDQIISTNKWVYDFINNGVYRCGFAQTQAAYDEASIKLFEYLDYAEEILSKQRYLIGDRLTEADIRLFVTLIRFDEVYVVHFKTSKKCIREYPNLLDFCRELYQIKEIEESVNMNHIRSHYFTSHDKVNKFGIIAISPQFLSLLNTPHNRNRVYKVE